jgi:hypothetical protein
MDVTLPKWGMTMQEGTISPVLEQRVLVGEQEISDAVRTVMRDVRVGTR